MTQFAVIVCDACQSNTLQHAQLPTASDAVAVGGIAGLNPHSIQLIAWNHVHRGVTVHLIIKASRYEGWGVTAASQLSRHITADFGEIRSRKGGQGLAIPRDVCLRCLQRGHWKNECPEAGVETIQDSANDGNMQLTDSGSETYIDVTVANKEHMAMLDSGCEVSVCHLRLCDCANVVPVKTVLYAANGTLIPVLKTTRVIFKIHGMPTYADVFVSEALDQFILGYDFLERNNCYWLFGQHCIVN